MTSTSLMKVFQHLQDMTTIIVLTMCNCMHKGGHEMGILDIDGDIDGVDE
jgi:hypothetical protein